MNFGQYKQPGMILAPTFLPDYPFVHSYRDNGNGVGVNAHKERNKCKLDSRNTRVYLVEREEFHYINAVMLLPLMSYDREYEWNGIVGG